MYQSLGYGHGFVLRFWHVDCPDGRLRGQVKAKGEAVYQRLMAATESAPVTAPARKPTQTTPLVSLAFSSECFLIFRSCPAACSNCEC